MSDPNLKPLYEDEYDDFTCCKFSERKTLSALIKKLELSELNPYGTTPTLMDRDLVLYDHQIILEYLDERFPHPPLMPVDPMNRAVNRQLRYRITRDFYGMAEELGSEKLGDEAPSRASAS